MEIFLLLLLIPIIAIILSQHGVSKAKHDAREREIIREHEADMIIQRLQGIVKRKQPSFTKK